MQLTAACDTRIAFILVVAATEAVTRADDRRGQRLRLFAPDAPGFPTDIVSAFDVYPGIQKIRLLTQHLRPQV